MANVYWRDSQRITRFFMFDARAVFPIVLFLFHAKKWTFIFAIVVMVIFWLLERKGLNFTTALRVGRGFLIGRNRPRKSKLDKIQYKDYG